MRKFFDKIQMKLTKAIVSDAKRIMKEIDGEEIYSVALVTDSDGISVFMALNTKEYLEQADEEFVEMAAEDLSEDAINRYKEGTLSFTKWTPDEWGYSDGDNSKLNKISEMLFKKERENSQEYANSKKLFYESVINAFKNAISTKCFGKNMEDIIYFITLSDGEEMDEITKYSAKILNSEEKYQNFVDEYEQEY